MLGAVLGRLPIAVGVLVIVALVDERGGAYSTAGFASSAYALGMAGGHPWLGRRADVGRHPRLLMTAAGVCACGWFSLALLAELLPVWWTVPLGFVTGASCPPLTSAMRARWPRLVHGRLLERAYAMDTTVHEVGFVSGPLLLSLLVLVSTPAVAALACGALVVAGAWLFGSDPTRRLAPPESPAAALGPLAVAGVRALLATRAVWSIGLGAALLAIPAIAFEHGDAALAGLLMGAWSGGALIGGAVYGARSWRLSPERRYLAFVICGALAMAAFPAAPGLTWFALLATLSGLALAPWAATGDVLMQRLAPAGTTTEAFTWTVSLSLMGEAAGAAVGGVLVDAGGPRAALVAVAAASLATIAVAALTNRQLRSPAPV